MNIIAADDERIALQLLISSIHEAVPEAQVHGFGSGEEALAFGNENPCEIAFLDINMSDVDGIALAKHLKQVNPKINIIFVTAYKKYAMEALALHSSGYIMKPATKEKIEHELEHLRNPPKRTVPNKSIRIQCFGSFEIFVDDIPVPFTRMKSKELLAYLVDRRGAKCTTAKLADILWDDGLYDRSRQKQIAAFRSEMIKSLKKVGASHIISKTNDSIIMDSEQFDCDYYMALAGDTVSINSFTGEYMPNYSWAEFTTAALMTKFGKK